MLREGFRDLRLSTETRTLQRDLPAEVTNGSSESCF
jgi:hypothetical protein